MKKFLCFAAFLVAFSFTSCTELEEDDTQLFETQSVEKDRVDPRGGEEDPEDSEG